MLAGGAIGGTPLEIVRPGSAAPPLSFTFVDPATQAAFSAPMAVTKTADGFTLTGGDGHGLRLSRTYSFSADKYLTEMLISIENSGDVPRSVSWEMAFGPGIDRNLPEKEKTDEGIKVFAAGGLDSVKIKKVGERKDLGPVSWAAIGNRYFLAALLPMEGSLSAFARRTTTTGEEIGLRSEVASLGPRQAVTLPHRGLPRPEGPGTARHASARNWSAASTTAGSGGSRSPSSASSSSVSASCAATAWRSSR